MSSWEGGRALHRASVLVFTSGAMVFAATAQGTPLDYQALVASEACISGSYGITAIGKMAVGRLPPPGHCTDSRTRHTPCLSVQEASACSGALAGGIAFRFGIHLVDYRATPKACRLGMPF